VAQLVLLDGRFATMPGVVAEGRRVIANIERSANLFVTKTAYAILIAVFVAIAGWKYPYLPRQLTIVSTFTIGIPGFFLALAPNKRRYVPGFLERVLRFTVPAGAVAATAALTAFGLAYYVEDLVLREARTCATLALCAVGLWVLVCLARPFNWWRTLLVAAMVGSVAVILAVPWLRDFYALKIPSGAVLAELVVICLIAVAAIEVVWQVTRRSIAKRNPEYVAAAAHID
jgi:cation-transporting ATPase E